jgi:MFS family permease
MPMTSFAISLQTYQPKPSLWTWLIGQCEIEIHPEGATYMIHTRSSAPPFRWSSATLAQRRVLIAAALGWMLDAFDVLLYSIVVTHLMRAFGMSRTTAGLLNALTLAASALGGLLFGLLADRFGRRRMLSASILFYSVCTFGCGLSTTIPALGVFRFLLGLGMGGEWSTGATLVAETWPAAWRGRALGIVQSSWGVGYALAAVVAWLILARASWRWVFFAGILPGFAVFWIQRTVPEPPIWERTRDTFVPGEKRRALRSVLRPLIILTAVNTFGMFGWWGLFTWIPAYLVLPATQGGRGLTAVSLTGFLVTINLLGMVPGYLLFGVAADRFGRRRTLVGYLLAAAAAVPLMAGARQPVLILVSACVAAFFGTGFFTGSGLIGGELFPTSIRATALGVSYNVGRGLSALAPATIGALSERHGLPWAFTASAVAFAAAGITALLIPETIGTELN